jgi:hypothetical protein
LNEIRIECCAALDDTKEIVDGLFFTPGRFGRHNCEGLSKGEPGKCKSRRARAILRFPSFEMEAIPEMICGAED